jgi:hypothetical protein
MNTSAFLLGTLVTGSLLVAGCGKSGKGAGAPPPTVVNGVSVDVPKLEQSITNKAAQATLAHVGYSLRYGDYASARQDLAKLASTPGLTEEQKKTVSDLTEQLKQAVSASPPAR